MMLLTEVIHNGCELSKDDLTADLGKIKTIAEVFAPQSKADRKIYRDDKLIWQNSFQIYR